MGSKGLRYLEWSFDPDPVDSSSFVHYSLLLHEGERICCMEERHEVGLFTREFRMRSLEECGLEPALLALEPSAFEAGEQHTIFVGVRPQPV